MGDVYRAWDTSLEREVVVKVLARDLVRSTDGPLRFRREAQRAAQVGAHPNIVSTFGAGEAEGWHYIAMEFLQGEDLGQLIEREGALPPARVLRFLVQAAAALDYLHGQNPSIIHRDVKPANFMVLHGDRLILTDFGLARRLDDSGVTKTGTVLGSPNYMAPEQAMSAAGGPPVGKAADIYSLGAMAYEMLCGRPPFVSNHFEAVLAAHQAAPVPPVRQWRPELPEALDAVLARALAKRPEKRQESAGTLVGELSMVLAGGLKSEPLSTTMLPHIEALATQAERAPLSRVESLSTGTSAELGGLGASAIRLSGIAAVSLAVVGLMVTTSLGVDREVRMAQQKASTAEHDVAMANSRLETAEAAREPTAIAMAMETSRAADENVADANATLRAVRTVVTVAVDPRASPSRHAPTEDFEATPQIELMYPVGGTVTDCTIRFTWAFDGIQPLDRANVRITVCRNGNPLDKSDQNCSTAPVSNNGMYHDLRFDQSDGPYSWLVESTSPPTRSEVGSFNWAAGNCGPQPGDDEDHNADSIQPRRTATRINLDTPVPETSPTPKSVPPTIGPIATEPPPIQPTDPITSPLQSAWPGPAPSIRFP